MSKILIKGINIIDGSKDCVLNAYNDVLIVDNKITKIDTKIEEKKDYLVIDAHGKYLMPGLINLHAHLPAGGKVGNKKISDTKKLVKFILSNGLTRKLGLSICKKNAQLELYSGTTTVRCVGGIGKIDSILRDKINNGKVIGPRLFVANTAIGVKDGHMDGTVASSVNNVDEIVNRVVELKNEGVDFIKLMITGGVLDSKEVGHPAQLRMNLDLVKAACTKAHELGLKVAAHVESSEGMEVAIKGGVDSIEHGALLNDEKASILKDFKGSVVTTISPTVCLSILPASETPYGEEGYINTRVVQNGIVECAKLFHNRGYSLGSGNDAGSSYVTHYNFYREAIHIAKRLNVSNANAIYYVTHANAKILGLENVLGLVKEGYYADLLILDENPLEDLETLKDIKIVIKDGKIIKHRKYKKIKAVDKANERVGY